MKIHIFLTVFELQGAKGASPNKIDLFIFGPITKIFNLIEFQILCSIISKPFAVFIMKFKSLCLSYQTSIVATFAPSEQSSTCCDGVLLRCVKLFISIKWNEINSVFDNKSFLKSFQLFGVSIQFYARMLLQYGYLF